jgi:hypothetical protein
MKKIFTTVFAVALTTFTFAQSIRIYEGGVDVTGTTIYDTISAFELTVHDLELHNTTTNTVRYQVNRSIMNPPLESESYLYFCTGTQCYSPQSGINWTPSDTGSVINALATLPSGPGTYGIAAHYDADSLGNTTIVKYRVYNRMASGDTAFVIIHYINMSTGVEENEKLASGRISAVYPNPANSVASIKYDMNQYAQNGKIQFYDMLGKKVKEIELTEKQGIAKVDVTEFNSGIYFYSFLINDKVLTTKKMVVSK